MSSNHGIIFATSNITVVCYNIVHFNHHVSAPIRFHEDQAASSQTLTLSQIASQANSSLEEEFPQQDIRLTMDDLRNVTKVYAPYHYN